MGRRVRGHLGHSRRVNQFLWRSIDAVVMAHEGRSDESRSLMAEGFSWAERTNAALERADQYLDRGRCSCSPVSRGGPRLAGVGSRSAASQGRDRRWTDGRPACPRVLGLG